MVRLAARREGTGHGEQDDFLVYPFFAGVVFLRTAAGGWVSVGNGCPSVGCDVSCDVGQSSRRAGLLELDALRELVADFEGCHCD